VVKTRFITPAIAFYALFCLILTTWPTSTHAAGQTGFMISAANPHAARAGRDILQAGGSAIDAAIAATLVLNLVEPQSAGIGGGAFLLHYDSAGSSVAAYDGRETAPAAAGPGLFLKPDGSPMGFWEAVVGGRAVGAPGLLRLFEQAHADYGKLAWKMLFEPAIALAEEGFEVSPRLHALIERDEHLATFSETRRYFFDEDGVPRTVGYLLKNPAFAETLRTVAEEGASAFYEGEIAADIVATVQGIPDNPGKLTLEDLAGYEAKKRGVICAPYRRWRICGMPPPTSGGVAVLQTMGILSHFDLPPPLSAQAVHLIAEASRLAFADRNQFLADSDFVEVPVIKLLDPGYLKRRAGEISPAKTLGTAEPGLPKQRAAMPRQTEPPSTTHLVVRDSTGNAVSLTASVENAFGSRVMVRGFLLNNQLTDFSFRPEVGGAPIANRVEPGKRPRSSMSPTLVFDDAGQFVMAIGSPGGSRIPAYVIKTLVGTLDWGLTVQEAIDLPNFANRNGATDLEEGTYLADMASELEALGHSVKVRPLNSGLHGLMVTPDGLGGGADPRREGVVLAN